MTILTDCHTHLDHFPPSEIPEVLQRARDAGVGLIVSAGTTLDSSKACVELANTHRMLYAGVGIHPMDLGGPIDNPTYTSLIDMVAGNPKVVCISEIGLDFLPTSPDHQIQFQAFHRQIGLARELNKPVIVHSRDSHPDLLRILRTEKARDVGGIMHYFQGSEKVANEAIDLGFFISLAKPLLRLPELQDLARNLPLKRIVLETDSAPQPWKKYRRNWTEPSHVRQVAEKLADIKELTVEEVIQLTTDNLLEILNLTVDMVDQPGLIKPYFHSSSK